MYTRRVDDLRADYRHLCEDVARGSKVSPRGVDTFERENYVLSFPSAYGATFLNGINRKVSNKVLAAEMMQWIAGVSDLAQLEWASPEFKRFTDDGTTLNGAYGPRAYAGLARVVRLLSADPYSRQATVSIWSNLEADTTKDLPCTINWSFIIRNGRLNMTTYMRSNDVWTGVSYDIPIMARIQALVAWALDVEVGTYTHHAQSFHIYGTDISRVEDLARPADNVVDPPFFRDLPELKNIRAIDRWEKVREWALAVVTGRGEMPTEFHWYRSHLEGSPNHPYMCHSCRYFLRQPELICRNA